MLARRAESGNGDGRRAHRREDQGRGRCRAGRTRPHGVRYLRRAGHRPQGRRRSKPGRGTDLRRAGRCRRGLRRCGERAGPAGGGAGAARCRAGTVGGGVRDGGRCGGCRNGNRHGACRIGRGVRSAAARGRNRTRWPARRSAPAAALLRHGPARPGPCRPRHGHGGGGSLAAPDHPAGGGGGSVGRDLGKGPGGKRSWRPSTGRYRKCTVRAAMAGPMKPATRPPGSVSAIFAIDVRLDWRSAVRGHRRVVQEFNSYLRDLTRQGDRESGRTHPRGACRSRPPYRTLAVARRRCIQECIR